MNLDKVFEKHINVMCKEYYGPKQAQIYNSFSSRFEHHGEEFIQDVQEIYAELMAKDDMSIPPEFR